MDIAELFSSALWDDLYWRATKGDHPSREELIAAIREKGVPPEMGAYVADRLTEKRRRARPTLTLAQKEKRWVRIINLTMQVRYLQAVYKSKGKKSPRERALGEVATEQHISPDTLRKLLRTGLKDAPRSWRDLVPTRVDCEKFLAEEKEGGKKIAN